MSGIYVLKTKDGYRVNYTKDYVHLFGSYNDDTMNYDINADYLKRIFGNCAVFPNEIMAIQSAKGISNLHDETEDGIMVLKSYDTYTFEELLNGKANKTS
jgi:hypothetical protein